MDDALEFGPRFLAVFPLPKVVLFPRTLLPLHIFEPRYLEMTVDALEADGLISTALLRPGFEPLYYTRQAPIHATVAVGRIVQHERLGDGKYNVLVRGVGRATIVEESAARSYRFARIEPIRTFCGCNSHEQGALRDEIRSLVLDRPGLDEDLVDHCRRVFELEPDLDMACDFVAAGLPVAAELRQCVLDEPDAAKRASLLLRQLRTMAAVARNRGRLGQAGGAGLN